MTIKAKNLKPFNLKTIKITNIYSPYFFWWNEGLKKFWTFKRFPTHPDNVIFNGGKAMEEVSEVFKNISDDTKFEIREQVYNKEEWRFDFVKYKWKLDSNFFKTYKKTFDVEFSTENPIEVMSYDRDLKEEVPTKSTEFTSPIGASKIRAMLESLFDEIDSEVTAEFDWEDRKKNLLEWKFLKIKITEAKTDDVIKELEEAKKSGDEKKIKELEKKLKELRLETKYIFSEGKEFVVSEINLEDIPF